MNPYVLAGIGVGAALLLLGGSSRTDLTLDFGGSERESGQFRSDWPSSMSRSDRRAMLDEIRSMVAHVESQFGPMPGLADFLVATAFRESNFNPHVQAENTSNSARGLYQMRPNTVFKDRWGTGNLSDATLLFDPVVSTAFAIAHVYDGDNASQQRGSQVSADWGDIRRWWGLPSRVHDHDLDREWSRISLDRFQKAIIDVNSAYGQSISSQDFLFENVDERNYPGFQAIADALGVGGVV